MRHTETSFLLVRATLLTLAVVGSACAGEIDGPGGQTDSPDSGQAVVDADPTAPDADPTSPDGGVTDAPPTDCTGTGTATLAWDANAEADLGGYVVYYSTQPRVSDSPPGYAAPTRIDMGNVLQYTVADLARCNTYYFSISAYDTSLNESMLSGEVSKYIP